MYLVVDKYRFHDYKFVVEFDTGSGVGCELSVDIYDLRDRHVLSRFLIFGHEEYAKNFARKFANSADYRNECLNGSAAWARLEKWYLQNMYVYAPRLTPIRADEKIRAMLERHMKQLYKLLRANLSSLHALPEYQEHLEFDRQSGPFPPGRLDANIERAVLLFSGIPDVRTEFSCEGIRHYTTLPEWEHGPIWFPSGHNFVKARIGFKQIPDPLREKLDSYLQEQGVGYVHLDTAEALEPEVNISFIAALERFADPLCVKEVQPGEIRDSCLAQDGGSEHR